MTTNLVLNFTNSLSNDVLAENTITFPSAILDDPSNYEIAVTSASIDLSGTPSLVFSPEIRSDIIFYYHEFDIHSQYIDRSTFHVSHLTNFTGLEFNSEEQFFNRIREIFEAFNGILLH